MRTILTVAAAAAAFLTAGSAFAQTAGEDWHVVSRSSTRVYLVDINGLATSGEVSSIRLARVPAAPPTAGQNGYSVVEMEFRCAAKTSRALATTDYDQGLNALDRFEDDEPFSSYDANSLDGYLAAVVCDGARSTGATYPSIQAFIDGGRH